MVFENRTPILKTDISSQSTGLLHTVKLISYFLDFASSLSKKSVFSKSV